MERNHKKAIKRNKAFNLYMMLSIILIGIGCIVCVAFLPYATIEFKGYFNLYLDIDENKVFTTAMRIVAVTSTFIVLFVYPSLLAAFCSSAYYQCSDIFTDFMEVDIVLSKLRNRMDLVRVLQRQMILYRLARSLGDSLSGTVFILLCSQMMNMFINLASFTLLEPEKISVSMVSEITTQNLLAIFIVLMIVLCASRIRSKVQDIRDRYQHVHDVLVSSDKPDWEMVNLVKNMRTAEFHSMSACGIMELKPSLILSIFGGSPEVTGVCPTLVPSPGGRLVGSCVAASEGDTCQMVCLSGYRPSDTRVLVCQSNGQWSSTLPRCIASQSGCPSVQVPSGSTSGSCNPGIPGQSCTITCQAGYTLVGNPTIFCQTDGQWSSGIPSCNVRSCPSLLAPSNGGTSGQCNPGSVGQSCSFLCNGGYTLVGQSTLVCGSDGRWSGNAPVCRANGCPALVPPPNGGVSGTCVSAIPGQSCSFSCQAGYNLNGQATLYCQPGGTWSSAAPTCVAAQPTTCSSLVAPDHGYNRGTCQPGRVGETCVFSCDNNYVLRGQRTLTCQSGGRWSDYTPICERSGEQEGGSCSALDPPPNGHFVECDNRPGGRCIVACEQGYLRSGSRVRTCLTSGFWSGFAPTCTRQVGYTRTTYKVVPLWSLVFG
ncbi:hypothetical protein JTE90_004869 [Oedothorax gibbosus]|uniref:Sushi domain-containing protein n=1 Tax=Oedothorax gibbosus TaxID=931172 RepID=A0AAV6UTR2_9ARAC|nr:hypothetical protein JTE90_004869 [Oedothorax gibbosus]